MAAQISFQPAPNPEASCSADARASVNPAAQPLNAAAWPKSFQDLYCEQKRCPTDSYARRVFWHALRRECFVTSALLFCFHPRFFARDFITIHKIGTARSRQEFEHLLNVFHRVELGSLRAKWNLRISGQRLIQLMEDVAGGSSPKKFGF